MAREVSSRDSVQEVRRQTPIAWRPSGVGLEYSLEIIETQLSPGASYGNRTRVSERETPARPSAIRHCYPCVRLGYDRKRRWRGTASPDMMELPRQERNAKL